MNNLPIPAQDGSGTITTGGTAQNLFNNKIPSTGFEIGNPDTDNDLWVSDTGTAAANAAGSYLVPPRGWYRSPVGYLPSGTVSIVGGVTGQVFSARSW